MDVYVVLTQIYVWFGDGLSTVLAIVGIRREE